MLWFQLRSIFFVKSSEKPRGTDADEVDVYFWYAAVHVAASKHVLSAH